MPSSVARWRDFSKAHLCFGPLVTPADILNENASSGLMTYDDHTIDALKTFARYVATFLTRPHPTLGRPGPVCPFTSGALERGLLRITAASLDSRDRAVMIELLAQMQSVVECLSASNDNEVQPGDDIYKAIVMVFPRLPLDAAPELIGDLQKQLKPSYIERGLMIGEFFPGCPTPGLHNESFRPLDAPIPSLAIRKITVFDAPFMMEDDRHLAGYLAHFGDEGVRRLRAFLDKASCSITPAMASRARAMLGRVRTAQSP